jgi:hypothetical protein
MAELQDDNVIEDTGEFQGDPEPKLKTSDRKRLDSIVVEMYNKNATPDEIRFVVEDFKKKYAAKPLVGAPKPKDEQSSAMSDVFGGDKKKYTKEWWQERGRDVSVQPFTEMPKQTRQMIQRSRALGTAKEAQEKIIKELHSNDDVVEKWIRQQRFETAAQEAEIPTSEVQNTGMRSFVEPMIKPGEEPVTAEDIALIKSDAASDHVAARMMLNEVIKLKPDKKRDIQKSVYILDAARSAGQNENGDDRYEKINRNVKEIEKGTLIYDVRNARLIRPQGVVGSLLTGWQQKSQLFDDYSFLNSKSDEEVISELEKRRTEYDPDEPIPVPKNKVSELTQMVGSMPLKSLFAGGVTSLFAPQAAPFVAGGVGAIDFYKMGYAGALQNTYNQLRDEGKSEQEALQIARSQAQGEAAVDAAVGGSMNIIGMRIGAKPINFSAGYKKAAFDFLKGASKEGAIQSVVGAGGEYSKNLLAQAAGIKRGVDDNVLNAIESNFLLTIGIGAAANLGRGIPKIKYRSLLNGLKNVPENALESHIQTELAAERITEQQAENIRSEVKTYKELDAQIPENVTEEARLEIQKKLEKRNELESKLETLNKAFHAEVKEKINALDEEINALAKQTEPKAKEPKEAKEARLLIDDAINDGLMNDIYAAVAKDNPEGFMKFVADQSFGRTDDGTVHEAGGAEGQMREQFGDAIVDHAKEMFPLGIKQSSISVIRPEEQKKVEAITIKPRDDEFESLRHSIEIGKAKGVVPEITAVETRGGKFNPRIVIDNLQHEWAKGFDTKEEAIKWIEDKLMAAEPEKKLIENAIPEQSADAVPVRETSDNSGEVVEGVRDTQELAGKEVGQESNVAGEEGVAPPTEATTTGGVYVQRPGVELSHGGLQDVANEFSLPDVKTRERKSDIELRKEADVQAREWAEKGEYAANIERLTQEAERGEVLTDKERVIMEQHLANIMEEARLIPDKSSPEYAAKFAEISRLKKAGEKTRSEAGAALRIPGTRSTPTATLEDAIIAKEEAVGRPTTPEEKKEVNEKFEKIDKAQKSLKAKGKEMADLIRSLRPKTDTASAQLFGLPLAIYDTALVTIANAVEAGANLADAIQSGIAYIKQNGGFKNKKDEKLFASYVKGQITYDERLQAFKDRTVRTTEKLKEKTAAGDFEPEPRSILELDEEARQLRKEYRDAKYQFELELQKDQLKNRPLYKKALDIVLEPFRAVRTLITTIDLSAVLNQGAIPTIAHPTVAAKAFPEMLKQAFNKTRFDEWLADLKESPLYDIMEKSKLYIADPNTLHLSAKEENFMSNLAEKIPLVGQIVKGSERAYVSYLNKMRADLFRRGVEVFMSEGKTIHNSPELYEGLANFLNNATGRGKLGPLEGSADVLNTALFSPRLMASRINMLGLTDAFTLGQKGFYSQLPKEVRIMAIKDMIKFIAFGTSVLALSKLAGAEVEDDPRSTDFGKMKFGNTRYDLWGGFQSYVRLIAQVATGQTKSTSTGEVKELNPKKRFDRVTSFLRGKLAPVPGSIIDIAAGENIIGEPATLQSEALESVTPMIISDVREAMKDKGIKALFTVGLPAVVGVHSSTYNDSESNKSGSSRGKREGRAKREKRNRNGN